MGDKIGVLDRGRLVQVGTPARGLRRPAQHLRRPLRRLAADEPVRGPRRRTAARWSRPAFELPLDGAPGATRPLIFGIRPEDIRLEPGAPVEARVHDIENHGVEKILTLRVGERMLHATVPGRTPVEIDEAVRFGWNPGKVVLFDATSGVNLRHAS